jgi:hypothetical protein
MVQLYSIGAECVNKWSVFCLELSKDGNFLSRIHVDSKRVDQREAIPDSARKSGD